jgi:chaperone modulatory protein CbpM
MITIETLCFQLRGLRREDVEHWISQAWVRPDGGPGHYLFHDIDVARVRLILELREQMQVNEEALPVVLSLLDQLYEARRRMRRVRDALDRAATSELRQEMLRLLVSDPT